MGGEGRGGRLAGPARRKRNETRKKGWEKRRGELASWRAGERVRRWAWMEARESKAKRE